jgi:hypothetical protein
MIARCDRALGHASDNIEKHTKNNVFAEIKKDYGMTQGEAHRARGGSSAESPANPDY